MQNRWLVTVLAGAFLTACGPGNQGLESASVTLTGKVIDGYISGATVYLDLNNNGRLDPGEPSAQTDAQGLYHLHLSGAEQECLDYVPLVADIPSGAIDQEHGTVLSPYQMSFPARLGTLPLSSHITPLTSQVWETVLDNLSEAQEQAYRDGGCQSVRNNDQLLGILQDAMLSARLEVSQTHGLHEGQLFADYIEAGDHQTQALAELLVQGLQRSYREKQHFIGLGYEVVRYVYRLHHREEPGYWQLNYMMRKDGIVYDKDATYDLDFANEAIHHYGERRHLPEDGDRDIYVQQGLSLQGSEHQVRCAISQDVDYMPADARGFFHRDFTSQTSQDEAQCRAMQASATSIENDVLQYQEGGDGIQLWLPQDNPFRHFDYRNRDDVRALVNELKSGNWRWDDSDQLHYFDRCARADGLCWRKFHIGLDRQGHKIVESRDAQGYVARTTFVRGLPVGTLCASDPTVPIYDVPCERTHWKLELEP